MQVMLNNFQHVWRNKGESQFINNFMKSYGNPKWCHWYIASVPAGHGTDMNCEERVNKSYKTINASAKCMHLFLTEKLPEILTHIGKKYNILRYMRNNIP